MTRQETYHEYGKKYKTRIGKIMEYRACTACSGRHAASRWGGHRLGDLGEFFSKRRGYSRPRFTLDLARGAHSDRTLPLPRQTTFAYLPRASEVGFANPQPARTIPV